MKEIKSKVLKDLMDKTMSMEIDKLVENRPGAEVIQEGKPQIEVEVLEMEDDNEKMSEDAKAKRIKELEEELAILKGDK